MTWNYRVIRNPSQDFYEEVIEPYYTINEVFYDKSDGKPYAYGPPSSVLGNSVEDIRLTLEQMARALEEPVLDARDVGGNFSE